VDQKVNCRVINIADGSKHLVFTIQGTEHCVGEIRMAGDPKYLLVMADLFSQWANMQRGKPVLASSIRNILNGQPRRLAGGNHG
jgi:hypothetical protein